MTLTVGEPRYGGGFAVEGGAVLPFVVPGELLDAAGAVVLPAPERVAPGCAHFRVCGGCHYQHGTYAAQAGWKLQILQGLAADAGTEVPAAIGVETSEPWGYRNRLRMRVEIVDGALRVGYSRRGSNEFLPVVMCPIASPLLWRAVAAVTRLAAEDTAFVRWMSAVAEVEVFCTGDEARLQAQFFLREAGFDQRVKGGFARVCEALKAAVPELTGAGALLHPELGRRARRSWEGAAWGASGLMVEAAERGYWVSRGAFFQVNRFLVERLVGLVCDGAEGKLAWDLFAGVGLFSQVLAERFARVIAVEGGEVAAADLAAAGRGRFEARRMSTLDFLREQEHQRERPDLVVLDPPRAGLGAEGAGVLAKIGPARVLYVSCDPVTLMRDVAVLVRGGYVLERMDLVDLFPQTFHMETVVRLRKA